MIYYTTVSLHNGRKTYPLGVMFVGRFDGVDILVLRTCKEWASRGLSTIDIQSGCFWSPRCAAILCGQATKSTSSPIYFLQNQVGHWFHQNYFL